MWAGLVVLGHGFDSSLWFGGESLGVCFFPFLSGFIRCRDCWGCGSRDMVMLPAVHYLPRSTLTVVTKQYSTTLEGLASDKAGQQHVLRTT